MIDFDIITRIEYMISFEEFPVLGGEYDLKELPPVFEHLEARIREEIAAPVDVVLWADNPEYATRRDLIVEVDWNAADLSDYLANGKSVEEARDYYMMDLTQALYDELPQWLEEAQEAAGVEFDRASCTECGKIFDVGDMVQAWSEVEAGTGTCLECVAAREQDA